MDKMDGESGLLCWTRAANVDSRGQWTEDGRRVGVVIHGPSVNRICVRVVWIARPRRQSLTLLLDKRPLEAL
jgi:hypothetical protein